MVKDHSDNERGNPLLPHGLLFPNISKFFFICTIPQDSTYHSLRYTSRGVLAGTRNSSMGPPNERSIRQPIAPWVNALTMELHLAPEFHIIQNSWLKLDIKVIYALICGMVMYFCQVLGERWWTIWAISHSNQCTTTGVCCPVSGIVHIKESLLLVKKRVAQPHVVAAAGLLSQYLNGSLP